MSHLEERIERLRETGGGPDPQLNADVRALLAAYDNERGTRYDAQDQLEGAERALRLYDFTRCDAPACNCGSWHSPEGMLRPEGAAKLRARLERVTAALAETTEAAAFACRFVHERGMDDEFIGEGRAAGIKDGFGVRARAALAEPSDG